MPEVFPTQHILILVCLTSIAYLLLHVAYSLFKKHNAYIDPTEEDRSSYFLIFWLLAIAFVVRIMLSVEIVGNKTDIRCFSYWGNSIAENGYKAFYTTQNADYPPGYMYVLGLMAKLSRRLQHFVTTANGDYDPVFVAFIKLPAIIADLAASLLVFFTARKKYRFAPSYLLMAIVAFSPIMAYISAGWGQIDQVLTLFLALTILAIVYGRPILGGALYGISILVKPQALMLGPIFAVAYLFYVFDPNFASVEDKTEKQTNSLVMRLFYTVIAVLIACAMIVVSAIPFANSEMSVLDIIIKKYLGTATSYKFATVNAYNLYALLGQNWARTSKIAFANLNYGQIGTIGMVVSIVFGIVLYCFGRKKNRGALFLASAFTLMSLFMLGHYMHERYMFPVLLLLLLAYIFYSDRRLIGLFFAFSVTGLINCLAAFYYCEPEYFKAGLYWDNKPLFWCSLINLVLFIFLIYVCVHIMLCGKNAPDVFADGGENENLKLKPGKQAAATAADAPASADDRKETVKAKTQTVSAGTKSSGKK